MSFSSIPILDLDLATSPITKPQFLADLRHALLEVGFLYIQNPPNVPSDLIDRVKSLGIAFFSLPDSKKLECQMVNAKSFLGYNTLGNEATGAERAAEAFAPLRRHMLMVLPIVATVDDRVTALGTCAWGSISWRSAGCGGASRGRPA